MPSLMAGSYTRAAARPRYAPSSAATGVANFGALTAALPRKNMPSTMQPMWIAEPTRTELTVVVAEWEKTPPMTVAIQTSPNRSIV